ncbi:EAL domain-containing protein [Photobacterium sp. TY1-4]|uniref:EAL domain-containing protein n=1 Tax=Photobacterium sp. TY1-4 TaxID=2899122 RepID=UPI0021BE1503|nr:EAL domain-containing protein [Photobacterium sp. TY1-4]UXI04037.1 EAL domain-containing protein [Photobacterium sp. TY1-4]
MVFGKRNNALGEKTSNRNMSVRQTALSFGFILGMAVLFSQLSNPTAQYYLSYRINADSNELLGTYAMRLEQLPGLLTTLSQEFEFDCSPADQAQLDTIVYRNFVIKRMSLRPNHGGECSSYQSAQVDSQLMPLLNQLSPDVSLWVANDAEQGTLLAAKWQGAQGQLTVHLEPLVSESLKNKYCQDCVLSVLTSVNNPTVAYWRGDIGLLGEEPLFRTTILDGLQVNAFIRPQLLAAYQADLWLPLFILGAIMAALSLSLYRVYKRRSISLHALVERGLARQEFIPYYQPIVDVSTNSLYGCEMLARWMRPGQGVVPPMEFIPYVEKSGQILPITEQLIEKAVGEMSKLNWQMTKQVISINVVPDQLESLEIMEKSLALLAHSEIMPEQIAFEVTERKQFTNLTMASDVIEQLRSRGIDVKLDDAGTGYGGFSYIQQLNIRSLKIDKMFVDNIGTKDLKLSLLDSIIAFGREAGMEMIAEGVETEEQSRYLAAQGVYLQQGYYFGKPMTFKDFAFFCKGITSSPREDKLATCLA